MEKGALKGTTFRRSTCLCIMVYLQLNKPAAVSIMPFITCVVICYDENIKNSHHDDKYVTQLSNYLLSHELAFIYSH